MSRYTCYWCFGPCIDGSSRLKSSIIHRWFVFFPRFTFSPFPFSRFSYFSETFSQRHWPFVFSWLDLDNGESSNSHTWRSWQYRAFWPSWLCKSNSHVVSKRISTLEEDKRNVSPIIGDCSSRRRICFSRSRARKLMQVVTNEYQWMHAS